MKQCGRAWLPEVAPACSWEEFLDGSENADLRLIASLGENPAGLRQILANTFAHDEVVLAVGPEGDFTEAELADAVSAGFHELDLGANILRTETAAIAGVAQLAYELR